MKNLIISMALGLVLLCSCGAGEAQVNINILAPEDATVSEKLLGFNIVYAKTPDKVWEDGSLAEAIKACKPGMLRYPGGTVNTYFHWTAPTGNGWEDSWNPAYDTAKNRPSSEFTDIDEYFEILEKTGAQPLLGINIHSGFIWDRKEEGLKEALDLMQYCKDHGVKVKYWYLGNEPYAKDCNGGRWTPARYAELCNYFAPHLKAFDPDIKLVANLNSGFPKNIGDHHEFWKAIGKDYIDVMDLHFYNMWGNATWSEWIKREKCGAFTGTSYEEEIQMVRDVAAEYGVPDLEVASLEWNVGPGPNAKGPNITENQAPMIESEMLIQFINADLDMATFWPMFWDGGFSQRGFYSEKRQKLLPISGVMPYFGAFGGAQKCSYDMDGGEWMQAAVALKDGKMMIAVLNKSAEAKSVSVTSFKKVGKCKVTSFAYDLEKDLLEKSEIKAKASEINLPAYSVSFITYKSK